ncbi:MAG: hypothetical protein ACHWZW_20925 [Spirulina sp.]
MLGNVVTVLNTELRRAFPQLFGGPSPMVQLSLLRAEFRVDPESAEALASAPRSDDRRDLLPFNPAAPMGPYQLSQPPYPGPRKLWLTTTAGDRVTLSTEEVRWEAADTQGFSLALRPSRDPRGFSGLEVLYGVTAIFTKLKLLHTLTLTLTSRDPNQLEQAEALLVGWVALHRQTLIEATAMAHTGGDYGTALDLKTLLLTHGEQVGSDHRTLTLTAESELKATRALRDDEGQPIERILTNGRPGSAEGRIDIHIDVQA